MTQPIQEPGPSTRTDARLTWGSNQLFRRPSLAGEMFETAWMAFYDDTYLGQDYDTSTGSIVLEFPYVDWSDNAILDGDGPFFYDAVDGNPTFGKDWAYVPWLMLDGLYNFTLAVEAESGTASDYKFRFNLDVGGDYPGRKNTDPGLDAQDLVSVNGYSQSSMYFIRSWMIPFKIIGSPPEIVTITAVGTRPTASADFTISLRNRLWITYLGPDNYDAATFPTENDPGPYGT